MKRHLRLHGVVLAFVFALSSFVIAPMVAYSQTAGTARRGDRREGRKEARDTKQKGRKEARKEKAACKKGDEKTRAECRKDKRGTKKGARREANKKRR